MKNKTPSGEKSHRGQSAIAERQVRVAQSQKPRLRAARAQFVRNKPPRCRGGLLDGMPERRSLANYVCARTEAEMRLSRLTRHVRRPRKNATLRARTVSVDRSKGSTQKSRRAKLGTGHNRLCCVRGLRHNPFSSSGIVKHVQEVSET